MKTNIIKLALCLIPFQAFSQTFSPLPPQGAEGTIYGESTWIDVQNDGNPEIIICGASTNYDDYTILIKNENHVLSVDSSVTFTPLSLSSLSTGDFNNDGFMDCIMTGYNNAQDAQLTILYLNDNNGGFNEIITDMAGTINGKIRNADFNNDGLLDVVITGIDTNYNYIAQLYFQDNQGQFIAQSTNLMGNNFGDITIFDADNNGDVDILLTGFDTNYEPNTMLFLNNGGTFTHHANTGIGGLYFTGTSVADIDNDNDLDVLITGLDTVYSAKTTLYLNDGTGAFSPMATLNCVDLYFGTADFIDGDDDGDLDLFITGQDDNGDNHSNYYTNSSGIFTEDTTISDSIIDLNISSTNWADYDNDEDMDLVITGFDANGDEQIMVYVNGLYQPSTVNIEPQSSITAKLYPNPNQGIFTIETPIPGAQISIRSTNGNLIYQRYTSEHITPVALPNISQGSYWITIVNGDQKIVKQIVIE